MSKILLNIISQKTLNCQALITTISSYFLLFQSVFRSLLVAFQAFSGAIRHYIQCFMELLATIYTNVLATGQGKL